MDCKTTRLSYKQTGHFPKIITDYLDANESLKPFYKLPVSLEGIKSAIAARQQFSNHRNTLVSELKKQYTSVFANDKVNANIQKLSADNCFTITTAHQPVIFTGTLYFIYKILHAIRLAAYLEEELTGFQFVPVFYMGSEDADLEELGKIFLDQEKIVWDTKQTGAVGRMKTKGLDRIINRIEGEFSVKPFGKELVSLFKDCYLNSPDIQTATFKLIHALFAGYGLVVLIPDNAAFKKIMQPVFEEDMFNQSPATIVEKSINAISKLYKVQANPREINLFYLDKDTRSRIVQEEEQFIVQGKELRFTKDALKKELEEHPENSVRMLF